MKKISLILTSGLLILSTACSTIKNTAHEISKKAIPLRNNEKEIRIYFTKSAGPEEINLVPVIRTISKEDSYAASAIRELFLGPTKKEELRGVMTEIPVGTRLIKVEESEDDIFIDISPQFLIGGGSATMQLRYLQLYKTLHRLSPYKKFYLQVDGKPLKTIGGEGLEVTQPISRINDYTKKHEKTEGLQP